MITDLIITLAQKSAELRKINSRRTAENILLDRSALHKTFALNGKLT